MISRRRVSGLTVAMALTALPSELCAQAGDPQAGRTSAGLEAEWVRRGNNFVCTTKSTPKLSPDEIMGQLTRACLRMGPLAVGDETKLIEPMLGKPGRTLAQPND